MLRSLLTYRSFACALLLVGCIASGATPALGQSGSAAVVTGRVVDAEGQPLAYANVQVVGTLAGAATRTDGTFTFTTHHTGEQTLRASLLGYAPARMVHSLAPGDTVRVHLTLRATPIELDGTTVTGRTITAQELDRVTISPLESVTTAGASGDLFRAVQNLMGVASAGDGAGLFVRGGEADETRVFLDQATLHYPYTYETPTGGLFSSVRPFLVEGLSFSTGGFSARYGNALSGVLALDVQDRPTDARQYLDLGLAGAALTVDQPLIDDRLGLRFSGSRSFTGLLFRVNGQEDDFDTTPQGLDGTLSLTYDYAPDHRLKVTSFAETHRVGVHADEATFSDVYRNRTVNTLNSLQWSLPAGAWTVQTTAASSYHTARQTFGALDLQAGEASYQLRTDAERPTGDHLLLVGGEVERRVSTFDGTVPLYESDSDPRGATATLDESYRTTRYGAYAEWIARPTARVEITTGLRADVHTPADQAVLDPRVSAHIRLSDFWRVRAAWGIYHQFASPEAYNPETGNPGLQAEQAQHVVAGLRYERDALLARLEAYYKPYRHLVVQDRPGHYANAGEGVARGLDAFVKYGGFLETRVSGWAAYSLLHAERTQARRLGPDLVLENGPAPHDITHHVSLVGKARLVGQLYLGTTLRLASGRPHTPIVGAVLADESGSNAPGGYVLPIEGPVGSERLPAFHRLDAQLSYYYPFGDQQSLTAYVSMNNVLDRANVTGYQYAPDYASRTPETTSFRRAIYVGFKLTL